MTDTLLQPDENALSASIADLIAGSYSSPWSDLIAGELSDGTAVLSDLGEVHDIAFNDVADRWSYVAAFVAANTATPLPDILDLNLSGFLAWHRQAARLATSGHGAGIRLVKAAIQTLADNPSIFKESP